MAQCPQRALGPVTPVRPSRRVAEQLSEEWPREGYMAQTRHGQRQLAGSDKDGDDTQA
ncbi:hypothetical protein J2Y48_001675 [Mycoplana sp. BE70]|nr:hypothetical protein [Mycoplana sp. BE70]